MGMRDGSELPDLAFKLVGLGRFGIRSDSFRYRGRVYRSVLFGCFFANISAAITSIPLFRRIGAGWVEGMAMVAGMAP